MAPSDMRLAGAVYVDELAALVVRFVNGRVFAVALTELEGVDPGAVRRVSLSSDGYAVLLEQSSGNSLEIPWDVVLYHSDPDYEFYRGRTPDYEAEEGPGAGGRGTGAVIGERIRSERLRRSWTLEMMSRLTGLKVPNLSRLENGKHLPSLETLEKVADALGVPVAALVAAKRTVGVAS